MTWRVQYEVDVQAPVDMCYSRWLRFEEFPQFMDNVERVSHENSETGKGARYHWVARGPLGKSVEWDAVVDGQQENKMIGWHSLPESNICVEGSVRFVETDPFHTRISTNMVYDPPAGVLGEAVADVFSNPQRMVETDMKNFRRLIEREFQEHGAPAGIDSPLQKPSTMPPPPQTGTAEPTRPETTDTGTVAGSSDYGYSLPRGNTPGNTDKGWVNRP